ncbi:hypothetical protein WOLCODRAFT_26228 [Wolfiporia cocos MD-104 SS10]|uniref:Uncharacterized protein n=1 Tax=Wolfiporia cocos (strain MD-104) TaxID=742152 RepID=A0A2H3K147_WOLCO|nr:hypothetical protein WOLCODRAFT_26228 [Wolfiporia cocos MD-104 SS10]
MSVTASAAQAVSATVAALFPEAGRSSVLLDDELILYPQGRPEDEAIAGYLAGLTAHANVAANSIACGSILAGPSSETDEFGDIAFWLGEGDFGAGHETQVLEALHLAALLTAQTMISPIILSSYLPAAQRLSSPNGETQRLIGELGQLRDAWCFRVERLAGSEGLVMYVLVGFKDGAGWAGLLGLGVWT